ncbi:uncharacterized protein LOC111074725 isoform X2 [Drosophila obscura]|uniref:uncharacterized protein LOC111074725 isoform X2 n=1 Tax=Drosophila obscura TaxID=7282 RepID=UPI001BB1376E|nr:uncharacterized protein LOC111074725 isoform X2 [Drosophila obscura]
MKSMGAEQSALLASTQFGQPEGTLELVNSELFFNLYFEKMPEPKTGPVTQALLRLVENMPEKDETFVNPASTQTNRSPGKNGEEDGDLHHSDSSEGGFVMDSLATVNGYEDRIELEPLQIAEFESMNEYDLIAEPVDPCPLQDVLPIFEVDVEDF